MPDEEPRVAQGHAQIAEQARANVVARRLAKEADEGTIRTAELALGEPETLTDLGAHCSAQVARLAAVMRASGARVGLGEVLAAERALGGRRRRRPHRGLLRAADRAVLDAGRGQRVRGGVHGGVRLRRCAVAARRPGGDRQAGAATGRGAAAGRRGARRGTHSGARGVERGGAAAREGLRRLHRRRARGGAPPARPDRSARPHAPLAPHGADQAPAQRARPAGDDPRLA